MGILSWIVFGAIAGWVASMVTHRNERMGCLANILIGVIGSFFGGLVMSLLGGVGVTGFNIKSLFVAILGAVLLLALTGWRSRRRG